MYLKRSLIYNKIGDKNSEFADLNSAVELRPQDNLPFRARIYEKYQMYDEAVADWTSYIELLSQPFVGRALFGLAQILQFRARIHFLNGKYDQAITDYQDSLILKPTNAAWVETQIFDVKQKQLDSNRVPTKP